MNSVILKRFDAPDELRSFEKGTFALVHLGGMTIGQATYEPGWKWSTHVGPVAGTATCQVAHVGMVVSGRAAVAMEDGTIYELAPGVSLLLRLGMIAGSSGRNPMCPSISLGQKTMPAKAGSNRQICPGHGLFGPSAQFRPARLPLPPGRPQRENIASIASSHQGDRKGTPVQYMCLATIMRGAALWAVAAITCADLLERRWQRIH